jgi:hypothetical protein
VHARASLCYKSKRKDSDSWSGRVVFVIVALLGCAFDAAHIRGGTSEVWIDIFYHFDIAIQRYH